MERFQIQNITNKLKLAIHSAIEKNKFEDSLQLISVCAQIMYQTNIEYYDSELENSLKLVSTKIVNFTDQYQSEDTIIFYDSFGLDNRGLAQIYLKALCPNHKVVYVTFSDRINNIPEICNILNINNSKIEIIERRRNSKVEQIKKLEKIIREYCPKIFFFYSVPNDVVATTVMYMYENKMQRYQINLTDHAFWLGAGCVDKCIEFRDYGASISEKYRKILKEHIVKIPFYPCINRKQEFEGLPFEKKDRKIIFSGGALYKTFSKDNLYYLTIDNILSKFSNTCFWYAGSGDDSKLQELIMKYPDRVFFTDERKDLYQLLLHCDVYYSTYPICGGLMFQYAASAGKVPLTLKNNEITDDFLLNQKELSVEFDSPDNLINECGKLLYDSEYYIKRTEEMCNSVIVPQDFDNLVNKLIENRIKTGDYTFQQIDVVKFRNLYLDRLLEKDLNQMLVKKNNIYLIFRLMPIRTINGVYYKIIKKIMQLIKFIK